MTLIKFSKTIVKHQTGVHNLTATISQTSTVSTAGTISRSFTYQDSVVLIKNIVAPENLDAIIKVMTSLVDALDRMTKPAILFEWAGDGSIRCLACAQRCVIKTGKRGVCQVRFNQEGTLMAPWGYVAGAQVDPIEKKPFNHFLPGCDALTFGMLGCDFHCSFCQNWLSSQVLRDERATRSVGSIQQVEPEQLVAYAVRSGAQIIASSYNEPLITTEWAVDISNWPSKPTEVCIHLQR